MSGDKEETYDMTHNEYVKKQLTGLVTEMDTLLGYYKHAESLYPYKNLEGETDVSNYILIFREVNNLKETVKEILELK